MSFDSHHGHGPHNHDQVKTSTTGPAGAETLLLLDEPGVGAATWHAVLGPLSEQFRIIRPVRDFLSVPSADVAAIGHAAVEALDAVGCARAHIAGCGFGGVVALWLAIHHPERVSRIAVIGASAKVKNADLWVALAARLRAGDVDHVASELIGGWLTPALRKRDPALVKLLEEAVASTAPAGLADLYEAMANSDLSQDIGRIAAPVLILTGAEDRFVPTSQEELLSTVPNAKAEVISVAAHLVTLEQPAKTVRALLDHFGSAANLDVGFRSRRVALGDAHVDKTIAAITPFTRSFQDFLTRYCWGEVWTRAGLSRRDRSLATISALVAIGAEHEIPVHVRAGLRHGLKIEEFPELYKQLALYTGLPRAFGALNITQRTLIEDGHLSADGKVQP